MNTSINKIEAIVDSIASLHEYHKPDSEAYQLRNPLLLRSFAAPGKHDIDDTGRRKFNSFIGGYKASYYDVELKIKGESSTGLKPSDRLKNLLAVYGIKQESDQLSVVYHLRKALANKDLDLTTPLSYSLEKK